jgi:hypothetical protein
MLSVRSLGCIKAGFVVFQTGGFMTVLDYRDIAAAAAERDPSVAPFGYLSGGSFVLDTTRVFSWFETVDELLHSLLESEPRIYDLEHEQVEEHKSRVAGILAAIRSGGFTSELRTQLNAETKDYLVIEWWGTFDELMGGDSEFAQEVRMRFRDDEGVGPVTAEEIEEFKEFLTTCFI